MQVFNVFVAVAALSVLIVIHELGHMLVARALGIAVSDFSLGFGPVVVQRNFGFIRYAIRAIPLGGYVQLVGTGFTAEEARKQVADLADDAMLSARYSARARAYFSDQSSWFFYRPGIQQVAVFLAGPAFSFLAMVPCCYMLLEGAKGSILGIDVASPLARIAAAFVLSGLILVKVLGAIFTGALHISGGDVSGPVGIVSQGATTVANGGRFFWMFVLSVTMSLGVLNLIPIPPLDGGQALFALWKVVFRRELPLKFRRICYGFGVFALLGFMVAVTGKDVFMLLLQLFHR